jgi:general secretion pathway protein D
MMKIQSVPVVKTIPLLSSIFISLLLGIQAQEPSGKEKKAGEEAKAKPQKPAESSSPKKDQEEYIEIMTPFGVQRVPKRQVEGPSQQPGSTSPSPDTVQTPPPASPVQVPTPVIPPVPSTAPAATQAAPPAQPTPAPPPSAAPPSQQAPAAPATIGGFRLSQVDLQQFINIIGNELKLNYVVDPRVKGIVTINTAGELRRDDLLPLLEAVLKSNGAAIVKTGNFYQIIPSPGAKQLPIPVRTQAQGGDFKKEDTVVLQIVPMRFVSATDMLKILNPYLSETGNLVDVRGNILIITETTTNLRKLLELVNIFDADVFQNKRVQLYPIKNNRSKTLVSDLENVFAGYALSPKDSAIKFISIDRINSILAISSNPNSFIEVEKWILKLDQPVENIGQRNYVYKIENSEAKNIANLLLQIYGQKVDTERLPPAPPTPPTTPPPPENAPPQQEKPLAGFVQGEIKIVADEINNMLIIQASPQDYDVIQETIKALDIVPRQVLIDAKIYEVKLTGALALGVSAFLQQRSDVPKVTNASFSTSATETLPAGLNISTVTLIGQTRELLTFLNARESRTRTRVLSSPSVLASDNMVARIQVGAEVPILSSQGIVPGGTGGTSLFTNTVLNRNTGVILKVTPRINSSGLVTLKIGQEVSSPVAPTSGGIQSPTISIRSVDTQATVKDGETIAIGGIIQDNRFLSKNRIPLLGDIPGLGLLFGDTSYSKDRTELIAFITPHVIQDIETAVDVTDELKSQLKGLKKDLQRLQQSSDR